MQRQYLLVQSVIDAETTVSWNGISSRPFLENLPAIYDDKNYICYDIIMVCVQM